MGASVQIETINQPESNNPFFVDHGNPKATGGPTTTDARRTTLGPGFCSHSQHPADILTNASFVTRFLAEAALHIHNDGPNPGLSENGAQGLYYILNAVEETINEAVNRL